MSKQQKLGQYELKKSVAALPLLQQKLSGRQLSAASHQLAHVVNRMFIALESKGILRTAPEEFSLASESMPADSLSAEFIRTFPDMTFNGRLFLEKVEGVASKTLTFEHRTVLPDAKNLKLV